jgi:site-specific recombinase XerD
MHLAHWEIPFEELTPEDLQAFFAEAALKPASRNLYLVMLGHLYGSLGQTEDNPVTRHKTAARRRRGGRAGRRLPVALSEGEEAHLLARADELAGADTLYKVREGMLIRFLLGTGLRISEAAALTRIRLGLDERAPRIHVIGKNDVERTVPIRTMLADQLRDYLERLDSEFHQSRPLVFPNSQGKSLAASSHYRAIQKHLQALGIFKAQMGPHVLRHTFVTRQFQAGVPPAVIKAWCGHADLGVTLKVYEGVASAPEGVVPV